MPHKHLLEAFVVSVAIHAAAAYTFNLPESRRVFDLPGIASLDKWGQSDTILISYEDYTPPTPKPEPTTLDNAKRLERIAAYKKQPVRHRPRKQLFAVDTHALNLPQARPAPAAVKPAPLAPRPAAKQYGIETLGAPMTRSSAELLADPQKGAVFSNYFGRVKEKIHVALRKKYSAAEEGEGKVTLLFILNSQGRLQKVSVLDSQSSSSEKIKELAKECVTRAAPFENFPQELALNQIAFNVTIYFEEL